MEPGSPLHQIVAASRFSLCTKSLAAGALAHHKMNKKNFLGAHLGGARNLIFSIFGHISVD